MKFVMKQRPIAAEPTNTKESASSSKFDKEILEPKSVEVSKGLDQGLSGAPKLHKLRGAIERSTNKKKRKLAGVSHDDRSKEICIDKQEKHKKQCQEDLKAQDTKAFDKQENCMEQCEEEMNTQETKAFDTSLLRVEKMRKVQAQLKSPYIVLK